MRETVSIGNREFVVVRGNDRSHPSLSPPTPRKSKYNAQSVVVDGVRFASKAEAERDAELQLLVRSGAIRDLKRQPRFPLKVNDETITTYVGDWQYEERVCLDGINWVFADPPAYGSIVVEDRKGVLTPAFKIKWALAKALHPEIEWRLS